MKGESDTPIESLGMAQLSVLVFNTWDPLSIYRIATSASFATSSLRLSCIIL
jgi:hypothetical protein